MSRYLFGGGIGDFAYTDVDDIDQNDAAATVDDLAQYIGGATITCWTLETGGSQITDLTEDRAGLTAITTLLSSDGSDGRAPGQIPPFYGPDNTTVMWVSADGGPRARMMTGDAADILVDVGTLWPPVSVAGTLTVGTGAHRIYNDSTATLYLVAVRASVGTAPTGAAIIVDVNRNGTTVYPVQAERPTIAISANTSGKDTTSDQPVISPGDYITVDVDQVGSTVAGSNLVVQLLVARVVT